MKGSAFVVRVAKSVLGADPCPTRADSSVRIYHELSGRKTESLGLVVKALGTPIRSLGLCKGVFDR